MPNVAKQAQSRASRDDLKRVFDSAIAEVQKEAPSRARTPIYVRKGTNPPSDQAVEERALSDAAQALTRLWTEGRFADGG